MPALRQLGFDDRTTAADVPALPQLGLAAKPAVLRRGTIVLIALGGMLAIVYGTLVPFNFQIHRPLIWHPALLVPHGGDAVANVLVYVPMGIFLRLLLRRRGSWWFAECAASLALAGGISYGTEVLQSLLPTRIPSLTDTLFNTAGAWIGVLAAPAFQRRLRQFHAWLYAAMRTRPFNAAAALATACIALYALAPFDIHPTPTRVAQAVARLQASFTTGLIGGYDLPGTQILDKWATSTAYGLLAFLLVLAAREDHRALLRSGWMGISRACCLAMAIEGVQLFTQSHVADWRDVELAACFAATGTLLAVAVTWLRPLAHHDPAGLVGPAVPLLCVLTASWVAVVTLRGLSPGRSGVVSQWLPVMGSFQRSWDALVAQYAVGLINYGLAAGLYVLWCRMRRGAPSFAGCVLTPLLAAGVLQVLLKAACSASYDTAHLVLAVIAGAAVYRMDRAICGPARRASASAVLPVGDGASIAGENARR